MIADVSLNDLVKDYYPLERVMYVRHGYMLAKYPQARKPCDVPPEDPTFELYTSLQQKPVFNSATAWSEALSR